MSDSGAIFGRLLQLEDGKALVRHERGITEMPVVEGDARPGDIVRITAAGQIQVLTPSRRAPAHVHRVLDPRRLRGLEVRQRVEAAVRAFFVRRGFREARTPLLVENPGMEPHIAPVQVEGGAYLPTSPEFQLKRLLVGGLERIFEIAPAFRREPFSRTHRPEFTLLEWYRAYAGIEAIMDDTEALFAHVAREVLGSPAVSYQGREISVAPPWPRLTVRDLFREHLGFDLADADLVEECRRLGMETGPNDPWDDLFFKLWLDHVEPKLPQDQAVFVWRYPPSQAALAVIDKDPDGTRWARRFEVFCGGLELANAFEELTDPVEQRARFEKDMALRKKTYGDRIPPTPLPETFLAALEEGMPPSGGIALGLDRLVMLVANEPDIEYTTWLPPVPL